MQILPVEAGSKDPMEGITETLVRFDVINYSPCTKRGRDPIVTPSCTLAEVAKVTGRYVGPLVQDELLDLRAGDRSTVLGAPFVLVRR